MSGTLVLVRHGQSEWNLKNLFTGWENPGLTDKGVEEAHAAGRNLKAEGLHFDMAFTSELSRAQRTLAIMLEELGQAGLDVTRDQALNDLQYSAPTALYTDDARAKWGDDQVHQWRRSYDIAPPGGESLRDTLARTLPYYMKAIQPHVLDAKTVIVAAHGNSLRALVMALEGLSPEEILKREIATGVPIIYKLNPNGTIASSRVLEG
jgi:2,3-bisphosphoglycerate-dependent phosphoglycerate mutase